MNDGALVIINADDFGYSDGVNAGIKKAYEEGVLTSTTVMGNVVSANASLEGLENKSGLIKPPLAHGVHLNLTYGKPLVQQVWNGLEKFSRPYKETKDGKEWKGSAWKEYFGSFEKYAVEREFHAQIEQVEKILGPVDHLDSHHGIASYSPILEVYEALALAFNIALRPISPFSEKDIYGGEFAVDNSYQTHLRQKSIRTIDYGNMDYFYMEQDPIAAFCNKLTSLKPGEVAEFMFHPAIDESQGKWRLTDLEILTSDKTKQTIRDNNIRLTTYGESAH